MFPRLLHCIRGQEFREFVRVKNHPNNIKENRTAESFDSVVLSVLQLFHQRALLIECHAIALNRPIASQSFGVLPVHNLL